MRSIICIQIVLLSLGSIAQEIKNVKPSPLQNFNISGNYRFYAQHRIFTEPYIIGYENNVPTQLDGRAILIGDASQLPELTLNISGRPNSKTSFGTDLIVWNQNSGDFDYYRSLQLGINLYGDFSTKYFDVSVKTGGIFWHEITPLTFGSFFGYNRFSVFERNPWDPQMRNVDDRYKNYLKSGSINQDTRWANQAIQGIILDASLPMNISIDLIYGKAQNMGAVFNIPENDLNNQTSVANIRFYDNTIPNMVYGGAIRKNLKKHTISLNNYSELSYSDALATKRINNQISTTGLKFNFSEIEFDLEGGLGKYSDEYNQDSLGFGELLSFKINTSKKLTFIPFQIHAYRISPNVVNNNSTFINTSVNQAQSAAAGENQLIGANGVLQQTGSGIVPMGQMANNRQAVNISTDIKLMPLTLTLGNSIAKEINRIGNKISYTHLNGLTLSRFWRWSFPSNVGPYNKKSVLYRSVFETVNITETDNDGKLPYDKYFNTMEAQLKYKFNLLKKPWYVFYLGSYNSVQNNFSLVTVFNEKAFLRVYNHQFENYYHISPKIILAQYLGVERIVANYSTQVNIETQRPINQEGIGIGLGIDYMMAKNTGLYIRHRYFTFEDKSFPLDKFSGHETTLEIKVTF
ncbi:MAG: hypothetical protein CMP67_03340 [Flavobacteriales bacterium]|nr:hypothetical protein [Flavobacteriales bacterium]